MLEELTESFVPLEFPHRQEQMNQIEKVFLDWQKFKVGDNLLISGSTGSGKTSAIKKIIATHNNSLYVSGKDCNTIKKVFMALTGIEDKDNCTMMQELIKFLKESPKIIIIDEIHRIKDFENFIDNINQIYRTTNVPIIVITNKRGFISSLPDDARYTLFFQRVQFQPYDAVQLTDILLSRLKLINMDLSQIPEGLLPYICGKVVNEFFGSARIAIDILRKCLKNNNFNYQFVNSILHQLREEEVFQWINKLTNSEKMFLQDILDLSKIREPFSTSDIQQHIKDLSQARISQLLTTFVEDKGILKENYRNMGKKGGRFRTVSFVSEVDKANFYQALHPEENLLVN